MRRKAVLVVLPAVLLAASVCLAEAPADLRGRSPYLTFCGNSHGADGLGDGTAGANQEKPPTNFRTGGYMKNTTDSHITEVMKKGLDYRLKFAKNMPHFSGELHTETVDYLIDYLRSIPDLPWGVFAEGREPYMDYCASCHGPEGEGDGPKPFRKYHRPTNLDMLGRSAVRSNFRAFKLVFTTGSHGKRLQDFPPTEEDLPKLFSYLGSFAPGRPLYNYNCTPCHGESGEGAPGMYKNKKIKPKSIVERSFLDNTTREDMRKIIMQGKEFLTGMKSGMPHFIRPLGDKEIEAVIAYMRASFREEIKTK